MSSGRDIAKYFYGKANIKITQKLFLVQIGIANALIKAGYTEQELKDIIDYLVLYPPKNGFSSLAYIQYVGNEILAKIKVKRYQETQMFFEESELPEVSNNKDKFQSNSKVNLKGQVKF